jgi:hypothetical protein
LALVDCGFVGAAPPPALAPFGDDPPLLHADASSTSPAVATVAMMARDESGLVGPRRGLTSAPPLATLTLENLAAVPPLERLRIWTIGFIATLVRLCS